MIIRDYIISLFERAKLTTFSCSQYVNHKKDVYLPPISGAVRLNRESGANPGQFPLL
jgi:hypothetical protein